MTQGKPQSSALPGWWAREQQRRQLYMLIFLVSIITLIGFYYHQARYGRIGAPGVIDFDTSNCITFVQEDKDGVSQIAVVRYDGTGLRQMTKVDDKSDKSAPTWTVDGKSIIYVSNANSNKVRQLYIMGDGDPKQLTYGNGNKDAPVLSPDRQRVAFVTQGAVKTVLLNGNDVFQEMPPAQSHTTDSDEPPSPAAIDIQGPFLSAAYSADGKSLAGTQAVSADNQFTGADAPEDQVVRVVPAGANKALILNTGREVSIAWDPTNSRLASSFTEHHVYAEGQATSGDPAEGPVHSAKTAILSGITLWDFPRPDQPHARHLLECPGYSVEPKNIAWSPDGKMIAFECWRLKAEGERELRGIAIMPVIDKTVIIPPTMADKMRPSIPVFGGGTPHSPKWSPDGKHLLFEVTRPDGGNDLCVINTDGTNLVNLTKGAQARTNNIQGTWAPVQTHPQ